LIQALKKEIELQSRFLHGQQIETIYFGGGTPSAIPAEEIGLLLEAVGESHKLTSNVEITLEVNPDDVSSENLEQWSQHGINRLSIGVQAFQDEILQSWNRSHHGAQALASLTLAREAGFENVTADLIYGGPGLTDEFWRENINVLIDSGIPHLSCYALTVETGTALHHHILKGKSTAPDDDQANRQYAILQMMMSDHGFEQYEISNFALPGMESKHNRNYWTGVHYLGIGPAAHSFDGKSRQWNVSNNIEYIQALKDGVIPFEREELTQTQRYNELVMTGLRTAYGISQDHIKLLGETFLDYLEKQITPFVASGQIIKNDSGNWVLATDQYFFADGIAAGLFFEE
jgi:oxygen-independent coproporphyrinogen-3 oxidase